MDTDAGETVSPSADQSTATATTISETSPEAETKASSTGVTSRRPSPTPPAPPHCLGARGYDDGLHDVGSFFVYRHEPQNQQNQEGAQDDPTAELELFGAAPRGKRARPLPSPLQYKLLDGLIVKCAAAVGGEKEVEGSGSDVAGRAFVVLQRQVGFITQALGSTGADPGRRPVVTEAIGSSEEDEAAHNGAGAGDANPTANGGRVANGKQEQQPQPREALQDLFALSNTDDNESVQGLVCSGGCMWIGRFGLPPAPPGENEWEMVDLWPRKVARFVEGGEAGAISLEGEPSAIEPLTAPTNASNGVSEAVECARRAHGLLVKALAELRPHVPTPSPPSPGAEEDGGKRSSAPALAASLPSSLEPGGSKTDALASSDDSSRVLEKVKTVPMSVDDSEDERTEEERSGGAAASQRAAGARNGKARRKRRRVEGGGAVAAAAAGGDSAMRGDADDSEDEDGEAESRVNDNGVQAGAGEITVAAVRESLLRNLSGEEGPSPEMEEWEVVVKNFISHVESLPPGTEQEELSLMFAAALDPTLVRMRVANTSLLELAEACALQGEDPEERGDAGSDGDGEDSDGVYRTGGKGAMPAEQKKNGFKVRLELEATEEGAPPPDGIAGVLRAVAAAASAVEAAARAEACVAHGGDTLGGLSELKLDYKRSLPPGPRDPIQFIIAEEQARVRGYVSAHEQVLRAAEKKVREAGSKVGDAYRVVEGEPGWSGVRDQVDTFLVEFEDYCRSIMPAYAESSILDIDLAAARKAASAAAAAGAASAAAPLGMKAT